jgi:hypothetical protein
MGTLTADRAISYSDDQPFFTKMAVFIAILIVVSFVQFSLRGFVNWRTVPWVIHVHALAMLAWLGVIVTQNVLAERGDLASHRQLGRRAVWLAVAIVPLGWSVGVAAIDAHIVPPFFTPGYFLALTHIEPVVFGALVFAAIQRRRDTQYHRRLMLGALIVITEPAFGRLLPMPMLGAGGPWLELACQLALIAVLALHDRRVLGRIHPATVAFAVVAVLAHGVIHVVARSATVVDIAASIAS